MEETGAFVATAFIVKSDGRRTCQFLPEQLDYAARMAPVSH